MNVMRKMKCKREQKKDEVCAVRPTNTPVSTFGNFGALQCCTFASVFQDVLHVSYNILAVLS